MKKYNFFKNTSYALAGVKRAFSESAFRIEMLLGVPLILIAIFINATILEKAILIGSILLIFAAECFNTAIECCVDLVTKERHILAKHAKDLGSAGVFFCIVNAAVIWTLIIGEKVL